MKGKLVIFSILLASLMLTGCEAFAYLFGINTAAIKSQSKIKEYSDKIEDGNLEASKEFITDGIFSNLTFPHGIRLRAADNVIKAYQTDSELGLDKLYYLIAAHHSAIEEYNWNHNFNSTYRLKHVEAIVRLAGSQALLDYAYNENFRHQESIKGYNAGKKFYSIQRMIGNAISDQLIYDRRVSVSGDLYQPLFCSLTKPVPYQKEIDLIYVRTNPPCTSLSGGLTRCESLSDHRSSYFVVNNLSPCANAALKWRIIAGVEIVDRIKNGNLAEAERCVLECIDIHISNNNFARIMRKQNESNERVQNLQQYAAMHIIKAYENNPNLDERKQELLEKSRELILKN